MGITPYDIAYANKAKLIPYKLNRLIFIDYVRNILIKIIKS